MPKLRDVINELIMDLGLRENISNDKYQNMLTAFNRRDYASCVAQVRNIFKLSMVKVRIVYVDDIDFLRGVSVKNMDVIKLREASKIAASLRVQVVPNKRTIMQVKMPPRMPVYGSVAFSSLTIVLKIKKSIFCESFDKFLIGIAHEMAHVILYAKYNPWRKSEKATDILVLLWGFMDVVERVFACGSRFYLSAEEFRGICRFIRDKKKKGA